MPRKGYKSITVREEVYDFFFNEWLKVRKEYILKKGISSFSGYVTYRLNELTEQEKKRNP
jgi:hypothetical protein